MKKFFIVVTLVHIASTGYAQINSASKPKLHLTLDNVINLAHERSISALTAKHTFKASYWEYRSYKSSRLPSLNLEAGLGNFNRDITKVQDPESGAIKYVGNYNLSNNLNLSVNQNIAFTGGTVSVYSSLERIDQFGGNRYSSYYAQPISMTYIQPIAGFNSFKWDKVIEPKKYEVAKRKYAESMERITIIAANYFFDMILEQKNLELARLNYENAKTLYNIASKRLKIGSVLKSEILQLELNMLNNEMKISSSELQYNYLQFRLKSYIGITESVDIKLDIPSVTSEVKLDYEKVINLWQTNSSFTLNNEISLLDAKRDVAKVKGEQSVQARLNARFGVSNSNDKVGGAYRNLVDQEVVGLSLSIPILDWGMSKGRVKMAESRKEIVETQIMQSDREEREAIFIQILEFNNQQRQCALSLKATDVAQTRYKMVVDRFKNGSSDVVTLNSALTENNSAAVAYITQIRKYWVSYFDLRQIALYDFIKGKDIVKEIDNIIQ